MQLPQFFSVIIFSQGSLIYEIIVYSFVCFNLSNCWVTQNVISVMKKGREHLTELYLGAVQRTVASPLLRISEILTVKSKDQHLLVTWVMLQTFLDHINHFRPLKQLKTLTLGWNIHKTAKNAHFSEIPLLFWWFQTTLLLRIPKCYTSN